MKIREEKFFSKPRRYLHSHPAPSPPFRCLALSCLSSFCGIGSFGKRRNRVRSTVLLHLFIRPRFSQRRRFVGQDVRALLASPRLDISRDGHRIVLEIAAFSRYFLGLRSPGISVFIPRKGSSYLRRSLRPSRLPRTDPKSRPSASCQWQTMWVTDLQSRILGAVFSLPPFLLNFSPARIIVSDASSGNPLACRRRKQTALDIAPVSSK